MGLGGSAWEALPLWGLRVQAKGSFEPANSPATSLPGSHPLLAPRRFRVGTIQTLPPSLGGPLTLAPLPHPVSSHCSQYSHKWPDRWSEAEPLGASALVATDKRGQKGRVGAYLLQARGLGRGLSPAAARRKAGGTASWCGLCLQLTAQQWLGGCHQLTPQAWPRPSQAQHQCPALLHPALPGPLSKSTVPMWLSRASSAPLTHSWPAGT